MLPLFQLRVKALQWHLLTCLHGSPSQTSQKWPYKARVCSEAVVCPLHGLQTHGLCQVFAVCSSSVLYSAQCCLHVLPGLPASPHHGCQCCCVCLMMAVPQLPPRFLQRLFWYFCFHNSKLSSPALCITITVLLWVIHAGVPGLFW